MKQLIRGLFACVVFALLIGGSRQVFGQAKYFGKWPAGTSPQEVGKRLAENFVPRKFDFDTNPRRRYVIYPEVCAGYGSLTVAQLTKNEDLKKRLIEKFAVFLTPEGAKRVSPEAHVDFRVFGVVPLEIYMQAGDRRYLQLGQNLADSQWASQTLDGITPEARYWIDDMYMITAVQFRRTAPLTIPGTSIAQR